MTVTKKQVLFMFISVVLTALLGCNSITASRREAQMTKDGKFTTAGVSGYEYWQASKAQQVQAQAKTDDYVRRTMADTVKGLMTAPANKPSHKASQNCSHKQSAKPKPQGKQRKDKAKKSSTTISTAPPGNTNCAVKNYLPDDVDVELPRNIDLGDDEVLPAGLWLPLPRAPKGAIAYNVLAINVRDGDVVKIRYKGSRLHSNFHVRYNKSDPRPMALGREYGYEIVLEEEHVARY